MIPRFTAFYIPILEVLSDVEEREINALFEEVANHVNISPEDRAITTRGGTNLRYKSNIGWAVTDLFQGGFIERTGRGMYIITLQGLELLEEKPEHPDRETLAARSESFRDFLSRKGTRSKKYDYDDDLFSTELDPEDVDWMEEDAPDTTANTDKEPQNTSKECESSEPDSQEVSLQELYDMLALMKRANLSTHEITERIKALEAKEKERALKSHINRLTEDLTRFATNIDSDEPIKIHFKRDSSITVIVGDLCTSIDLKENPTSESINDYSSSNDESQAAKPSDSKEDRITSNSLSEQQKHWVSQYIKKFANLRYFCFLGITGPHKFVLLLAIFHLIRTRVIRSPRFYFTDELEERYNMYWNQLFGGTPTLSAAFPFAHLGKDNFIQHKLLRPLANYDITWSRPAIRKYILHTTLDQKLFDLIQDNTTYKALKDYITDTLCKRKPESGAAAADHSPQYSTPARNHRIGFQKFMESATKKSGEPYSPRSIAVYIGALQNDYMKQKIERFHPSCDIFRIQDTGILDQLISNLDRDMRNGINNQTSRSSLIQYRKYLIDSGQKG